MFAIRERVIAGVVLFWAALALPTGILAADSYEEYVDNSWMTDSDYTDVTYRHRSELEDRILLKGIDVSWWQGVKEDGRGGRGSTISSLNWEKIHDAGIDFTIVRVASRDTADGSIYEDTCADSHIQGALENDINVGLYIFSQALDKKEAREEAEYVLKLVEQYGWDVSMPIVMDRESGSYKRLTAGKLTREQETAICSAFADVISEAGYTPMIYASAYWMVHYMDTQTLRDRGCRIWLARYNDCTDAPVANLTYDQLAQIDYDFWQYSSTGRVDGYSGNLDLDFWYLDTDITPEEPEMTASLADSITLSWSGQSDVHAYRLYRYSDEDEKFKRVLDVLDWECTDTNLDAGETYLYKLRPYWTVGGVDYFGRFSDAVTAVTAPAQTAEIRTEDATVDAITLSWDEVYSADGYRIYQYDEDEERFVKLADISGSTEYTAEELGRTASLYGFRVKAYRLFEGKKYWGKQSAQYWAMTAPAQIKNLSAEPASAYSINLSWKRAGRASGYQICRRNRATGEYETIAVIDNNKTVSYTDSGLTGATEYSYQVRAFLNYGEGEYCGEFSRTAGSTTLPAIVKNVSATAKSKTVTLKWAKNKRAGGYEVYRQNNKTGEYEKIATLESRDQLSYTDKKRKAGVEYTYRVRAWNEYNGERYYGEFSSEVTVKAK